MFTNNDNKKWVHFSWRGAALIRERLLGGGGGGKYGNCENHPYCYIFFVVFFKKFFPFMYVNSPNGFFGQICNPEISSKPI